MKIKAAGNLFTASTRKCRDLLEQPKLAFPRKRKYHWLNGDNPVNIMSTTFNMKLASCKSKRLSSPGGVCRVNCNLHNKTQLL